MARASKVRRRSPGVRPAWIPDALVIVRTKDASAGQRLLAALQPAIDAFADPVIVRICTIDEDATDDELARAGRMADPETEIKT